MQSIQEKLKYQMEINDISAHSLAKAAGVPESSIKNIVYGKSQKPRLELMEPIAKELHCTVADLLSDDDPRLAEKTSEHEEKWDGWLFIEALKCVMDVAASAHVTLSQKKANFYAERVYNYARLNNDQTIDPKFVRYLLLSAA